MRVLMAGSTLALMLARPTPEKWMRARQMLAVSTREKSTQGPVTPVSTTGAALNPYLPDRLMRARTVWAVMPLKRTAAMPLTTMAMATPTALIRTAVVPCVLPARSAAVGSV